MCPSCSSPTVLQEETRPQVNSALSVCLCHSCLQAGGGHGTCTKQPPLPALLISRPCPNSITSDPAIAAGFQLGVTGSLDSRKEVGGGVVSGVWKKNPYTQGQAIGWMLHTWQIWTMGEMEVEMRLPSEVTRKAHGQTRKGQLSDLDHLAPFFSIELQR